MRKISEEAKKISQEMKKMSQIFTKKPSLEEIPPDSVLPAFKPLPKIQLQRSSSLPRIEMPERPQTPSSPAVYQPLEIVKPSRGGMATISDFESYRGQKIPPNAKKLRVRSFLWVKPITTGSYDTNIIAQLLPVLAANLAALSSGLALGFSAILLPQLKPQENINSDLYQPFTADSEQGSWIASIFGLGAVIGGLISAYFGNKFGRRNSLMMLALPDLIGWILVAASQNLGMMLLGRFMAGFSAAAYSSNIQIYVAEISQPQQRGWLSGLTVPIMAIGVLIMYLLGSLLPWHLAACVCLPVPCLMVLSLALFWDSPYWYFQIGKDKSAFAALEQFRGKNMNVVSEVFQIQQQMKGQGEIIEEASFFEGLTKISSDPVYRKPFIILNILFLFMLFSGKFSIDFYAVNIFKISGGHLNEYASAVIISLIHLFGALLFIPLAKVVSRRILLISSSFMMGISLTLLGLSVFTINKQAPNVIAGLDWVPLIAIIVYMVSAPVGLCSIPFMYIAEFYPTEMRSVLGGLTIAISNLELFLVVKTFPNLEHCLGEHGVFLFYACACFGAILFTLSYIPETKDRPLDEVQDKFSRLRKDARVTPWVSPLHRQPSLNSLESVQNIVVQGQLKTKAERNAHRIKPVKY